MCHYHMNEYEPLPKPVILLYNSYANAVNKGKPAIHLLDTDEQ
jgi:hypothetical protein